MRTLQRKNALIHETKHFMTVLKKLLLFPIYYFAIKIFVSERKYKIMKNFIKGVATVAVVMIVSLIIHIICNKNGINLDSTVTGTVSAISALLIYRGLTRKEKTKND